MAVSENSSGRHLFVTCRGLLSHSHLEQDLFLTRKRAITCRERHKQKLSLMSVLSHFTWYTTPLPSSHTILHRPPLVQLTQDIAVASVYLTLNGCVAHIRRTNEGMNKSHLMKCPPSRGISNFCERGWLPCYNKIRVWQRDGEKVLLLDVLSVRMKESPLVQTFSSRQPTRRWLHSVGATCLTLSKSCHK